MKGKVNIHLLVGGFALGACHLVLFCIGYTTFFDFSLLKNANNEGIHIFGIYLFVRIFCAWWCSIVALRMNRNRWCWFIIVLFSFIPGVLFLALLGYSYPSELKTIRSNLEQEHSKRRRELKNELAIGAITKEEFGYRLRDLSLRHRIRMGDLEEKFARMRQPVKISLQSNVLENDMMGEDDEIVLIEDPNPINEDVLNEADTNHPNSDLQISS